MLKVLHIHRRAMGAQVSIERLFVGIRADLPVGMKVEVHVSPFCSKGLWRRVWNVGSARRAGRGRICHVTGDVHFLTLGLVRRTTVLTIHDCAVLHRLQGWRRWLVRKLWFEWPVRRAAVVTVISEATRRDLERWLPSELHGRIRVVPNAVRREFLPAAPVVREGLPVVLQVGTGWNKNVENVAAALQGLAVRWEVIGPVTEERAAALKARVPGVVFLGKVDDEGLVEAYRRADVVVFASVSEGFGLPILEAQATGRPVITSRVSPMTEVAGGGAVLVDPGKPVEIRAAVVAVLEDVALRERLVAEGFKNVALYQGPAVAGAYAAIYQELAAATGGGSAR